MPISTEKGSGFVVGKWERNYLKCRYLSHRNKIATAKPAVDSKAPQERSHVKFKTKKALKEEYRISQIMLENIRVLHKTAEIMNSSPSTVRKKKMGEVHEETIYESKDESTMTTILKRNVHVIFQWFINRFATYPSWWQHIRY